MQKVGPMVRIVLVGTEGEINLGFIARLAANFLVDEIYLVSPLVDPFSPEVRRFAAHGEYMIEHFKVVNSLDEALQGVELSACTSARVGQRSDVLRHPVTVREFVERIAPRYSSIAIVFGRESVGLTREELSKCHLLLHIPANPDYPVLNLSHAVSIVLYELWIMRKESRSIVEPAKPDTYVRIYNLMREIAEKVVDKERLQAVDAALKHILWKCSLTAGEASALYYLAKRLRRIIGEQR